MDVNHRTAITIGFTASSNPRSPQAPHHPWQLSEKTVQRIFGTCEIKARIHVSRDNRI